MNAISIPKQTMNKNSISNNSTVFQSNQNYQNLFPTSKISEPQSRSNTPCQSRRGEQVLLHRSIYRSLLLLHHQRSGRRCVRRRILRQDECRCGTR